MQVSFVTDDRVNQNGIIAACEICHFQCRLMGMQFNKAHLVFSSGIFIIICFDQS